MRLVRETFANEADTRARLADFVLSGAPLTMGEQVLNFEHAIASAVSVNAAVMTNSGSSANLALIQALLNLGRLRHGDRVAVSAITWATNVMPLIQLGLEPVPIDVDVRSGAMSLELLAYARDIRAVFLTEPFGFIGAAEEIAKLPVILLEDACEAFGSRTLDRPATRSGRGSESRQAGTIGLAGTYSFYVAHQLSAIEGGAVVTNDMDLARELRRVRSHGWSRELRCKTPTTMEEQWRAKFRFDSLGYNLRPTELQAFVGTATIGDALSRIHARRQMLERLLAADKHGQLLRDPGTEVNPLCIAWSGRRARHTQLDAAGIETRPLIGGCIVDHPFWRRAGLHNYHLPNARALDEHGFYCGVPETETEAEFELLEGFLR